MTLQASGAISLADVNVELGLGSTAQLGLADTIVRTLFGVADGAIDLASGYSKNNTRTLISGTLTGNSTLSIPSGVTEVNLTGQGGTGYNNYNAGQEEILAAPEQLFIDPWYDNPGHAASAATYKWSSPGYGDSVWTDENSVTVLYNMFNVAVPTGPCASDAAMLVATSAPAWEPNWVGATPPHWYFHYTFYYAVVDQAAVAYEAPSGTYHPGQPYIAAIAYQAYIAPSGGDHYGTSTTAVLNGVTHTWTGGYGAVAGTSSSTTMTSTGAGQTLTYSVAGTLTYNYYLP